jgi:integrase
LETTVERTPSVSLFQPRYKKNGKTSTSTIWWMRWREDGKVQSESTGVRNRREAERRARIKEEELANGEEVVRDVRWADTKKAYLKQKESVNKQATADAYGYSLDAFERLVKPNKLCRINEGTLGDFAAARKKEGMTPETCNKDLRACRAMLWWCVRKKWLKEIPKFKNAWVREDQRKPVVVPKEEYERILANIGKVKLTKATAPWWTVATTLLFWLGVRRGEIINSLKWENVNLDSLGSEELTVVSETSKGRKTRVLPLMPELVKMLREWRAANPDEVYVLPYSGDLRNLYSDWHLFAGKRVPKNGRSTTGSLMALANVPTVVIKDFLGHSSVVVTERYYTNTTAALRKAAEARAAG